MMIKKVFYGLQQPEINDAFHVRKTVFIDEQGFDTDVDEWDKECHHIVIYDDCHPVATGRLIIVDGVYAKIGRVAVLAGYRGRNIGIELMLALIQKAKEEQLRDIRLSSQLHAQSFYQKIGFIPSGDIYREEGVEHIQMCYRG